MITMANIITTAEAQRVQNNPQLMFNAFFFTLPKHGLM
jgi:hypothetical protein